MIMQLTEAQRSVLEPACAREDLCVFPIEAKLKGGAVGNVCKSLLKRGLVQEVPAADTMTVWRHNQGGVALSLQATEAGIQALTGGPVTTPAQAPAAAAAAAFSAPVAQAKKSRQDVFLRLLGRPKGATITDMVEATGWQPHSIRGALSGVIGKKLGLKVTSEKVPDRDRVYRVD